MNILIVEDDDDIRETLAQILLDEGHRVTEASNGQEALDALASHVPDLILLDLMMPVMDGWQFRAEQLRRAEIAGIPVVVVSADIMLHRGAQSLGDVTILRKPIRLETLLSVVREASSAPSVAAI